MILFSTFSVIEAFLERDSAVINDNSTLKWMSSDSSSEYIEYIEYIV